MECCEKKKNNSTKIGNDNQRLNLYLRNNNISL